MSFLPQMSTRIDGFSIQQNFHRHYWEGMVADLWHVDCAQEAGGSYESDHPRIFVLLDTHGRDDCHFTILGERGDRLADVHQPGVSFIPAGLRLRSELAGISSIRHLDLHFDMDCLTRRFGDALPSDALNLPRFAVQENKLLALADLIAHECASPDPLHQLYGEGLTLALLTDMLKIMPCSDRPRSGLAGWQLRKVKDFIVEHCNRPIRLEELSDLTGLSQSHFSHSFKASTGVAPHQYLMKARIDRIKVLLARRDTPLTVIAAEMGFADPAHFARTFRRMTGVTPSAWRRERQ